MLERQRNSKRNRKIVAAKKKSVATMITRMIRIKNASTQLITEENENVKIFT